MFLTPKQAVKKLSICEHKNRGDGARYAVPSISYAGLSILSTSGCSYAALLVTCSPFLDTVARFLRNQQSSIFSCNSLEIFPSRRPYTFFEAFWHILRACSCCAQFASLPYCGRDNILSPALDRMSQRFIAFERSVESVSAIFSTSTGGGDSSRRRIAAISSFVPSKRSASCPHHENLDFFAIPLHIATSCSVPNPETKHISAQNR